ncbi:MAG: two-component system, NtrC family, response regulator HydG [Acidobacteriota bacterium]|jgi:DNA-binding NtrC family response regulator|nr:two-component system, NtrC family, response regulator HydG [Acidobacteriota bacterium]
MTARQQRVLVVDDEGSITGALALILGEGGYEVRTAGSVAEAGALLIEGAPFDLVFTDLRLPDATGIELIDRIKSDAPDTQAILMTAHGSLDVTIEAIKHGAYYYIEKPFTPDQVLMLAARALQFGEISRENRSLKRALSAGGETFGLTGRSPRMLQIAEVIRTAAPSDASVLIEGESGTGKELVAAAFHAQSHRAAGPYIRINCAALPSELIESELFGYRKGAFTGADRDKRGLIEAASGGTLLLDEIAEMPAHLQTKLLRVLQDRRLRRLGDEQEMAVDFRLVCSTNRDTAQMISEGMLRKDLFFRVSTIRVKVPPLRERPDDVAPLAERFLQTYASKYQKPIRAVSPAAFSLLARYDWPGNVRELESVVEHAVLFARGDELRPEDLPEHLHASTAAHTRCIIPPYMTMEEIEREAIVQTLERTGGNVKKTAEILDYHRPTLYRKLKKFGLMADAPADEDGDEVGAAE